MSLVMFRVRILDANLFFIKFGMFEYVLVWCGDNVIGLMMYGVFDLSKNVFM